MSHSPEGLGLPGTFGSPCMGGGRFMADTGADLTSSWGREAGQSSRLVEAAGALSTLAIGRSSRRHLGDDPSFEVDFEFDLCRRHSFSLSFPDSTHRGFEQRHTGMADAGGANVCSTPLDRHSERKSQMGLPETPHAIRRTRSLRSTSRHKPNHNKKI